MATRRGPDNTVRVAIAGTRIGVAWANVFWVQLTTSSSISQSDLNTWLTAFANAYKTAFAPRTGPATQFHLATGTCFTPGLSVLQATSAMTGTGSEAGTEITDNAAAKVISWLSTVYWRGGKPRTYITGPMVGDFATSIAYTAGEVTNMTTAANSFRTAVNALTQGTITGTTLGFVSFQTGNAPRITPLFFSVTGATMHPRVGTQRRRLGRWIS